VIVKSQASEEKGADESFTLYCAKGNDIAIVDGCGKLLGQASDQQSLILSFRSAECRTKETR
jgi:hypothetical protein